MDLGLDSNIRANVAELQGSTNSTIGAVLETNDDSQISMLEARTEEVSLELDEEKQKFSEERAGCAEHLQEHEGADQESWRCRTEFQDNERRIDSAHEKLRQQNEKGRDAAGKFRETDS